MNPNTHALDLTDSEPTVDPVLTEPAANDSSPLDGSESPPRETPNQIRVAQQFVEAVKDSLLYDADGSRWLHYDGAHWNPEDAYSYALRAAEPVASRANIRRLGLIRSLVDYASHDVSLRIRSDRLDADPELLGVSNGVLDLRSGCLLRDRPDLLVTKSTGVAFDADAACDRWKSFLEEVLGDDAEV
jgi:putative DNA primase/helicase